MKVTPINAYRDLIEYNRLQVEYYKQLNKVRQEQHRLENIHLQKISSKGIYKDESGNTRVDITI
jgi:hypothetical protein|tara:strand:+ start:291 stop:482 length:192 start_codon:yes stop_codon:yes gene_type:complete